MYLFLYVCTCIGYLGMFPEAAENSTGSAILRVGHVLLSCFFDSKLPLYHVWKGNAPEVCSLRELDMNILRCNLEHRHSEAKTERFRQ